MKLVYQYTAIFFFLTTSNHLYPLQVKNCGSNSRLVVDEDDNGKCRPERVKTTRNRHGQPHMTICLKVVFKLMCYMLIVYPN